MYSGSDPADLNGPLPGASPEVKSVPLSLKDFVDGENPTPRGWKVLEGAYERGHGAKIVRALHDSGNKPLPTKMFPGFNAQVLGGMNGASMLHEKYFRLVLVHEGVPFKDNEVKFLPWTYLEPNPPGDMRCSD